jgi:predicted alpha/beta hydrolase family esterase
LVIGLATDTVADASVTGVAWGGYSLNLVNSTLGEIQETGVGFTKTQYWVADVGTNNATSETNTVTVNWSSSTSAVQNYLFMAVQAIEGVTSVAARGGAATNNTTPDLNASVRVTSAEELVLSLYTVKAPGSNNITSGTVDPGRTMNHVFSPAVYSLGSTGSIATEDYSYSDFLPSPIARTNHYYGAPDVTGDTRASMSIISFAIPEPTSLSLLAVGATGLLLRRRKSK